MADREIVTTVVFDDDTTLTFMEVCEQLHLSENSVRQLIEHGLLDGHNAPVQSARFTTTQLARVSSAARLRQDLGLNVPGVVLALELFDELEQLRQEIQILQRHLQEP